MCGRICRLDRLGLRATLTVRRSGNPTHAGLMVGGMLTLWNPMGFCVDATGVIPVLPWAPHRGVERRRHEPVVTTCSFRLCAEQHADVVAPVADVATTCARIKAYIMAKLSVAKRVVVPLGSCATCGAETAGTATACRLHALPIEETEDIEYHECFCHERFPNKDALKEHKRKAGHDVHCRFCDKLMRGAAWPDHKRTHEAEAKREKRFNRSEKRRLDHTALVAAMRTAKREAAKTEPSPKLSLGSRTPTPGSTAPPSDDEAAAKPAPAAPAAPVNPARVVPIPADHPWRQTLPAQFPGVAFVDGRENHAARHPGLRALSEAVHMTLADYLDKHHPGKVVIDIGSNRQRVQRARATWWGCCPDLLPEDMERHARYMRYNDHVSQTADATWCSCTVESCTHIDGDKTEVAVAIFSAWYLSARTIAAITDRAEAFYAVIHDFRGASGSFGAEATYEVQPGRPDAEVVMHVRGNAHPYTHALPAWMAGASINVDDAHYSAVTVKAWSHARLVRFVRMKTPTVLKRAPGLIPAPAGDAYASIFAGSATLNAEVIASTVMAPNAYASRWGLVVCTDKVDVYLAAEILARYSSWWCGRARTEENMAACLDHVRTAYESLSWPSAQRAAAVALTASLSATTGMRMETAAHASIHANRLALQAMDRARKAAYAPALTWWEQLTARVDNLYREYGWRIFSGAVAAAIAVAALRHGARLSVADFTHPKSISLVNVCAVGAIGLVRRDWITSHIAGGIAACSTLDMFGLFPAVMLPWINGAISAVLEENIKHVTPFPVVNGLIGLGFGALEVSIARRYQPDVTFPAFRLISHALLGYLPYTFALQAHACWNAVASSSTPGFPQAREVNLDEEMAYNAGRYEVFRTGAVDLADNVLAAIAHGVAALRRRVPTLGTAAWTVPAPRAGFRGTSLDIARERGYAYVPSYCPGYMAPRNLNAQHASASYPPWLVAMTAQAPSAADSA